ncbi:hypothetical protein DDR33_07195 [Pararcticibacter amylolyticus]|uniref:Uncharacterized protein n=2 Tax=Pararcticibacter amylolyticus TaxID=2173175 RepID=A0A2U2PKC1_9SPHI|nr:hypothetical protein DDR33_07195 [Pararcticibacter amylolyticus]
MSFHASGRMANEVNGILGMRWTLNCGGVVTRKVKGRPDEWDWVTNYSVDPSRVPTFEELYQACPENPAVVFNHAYQKRYDTEFDIFNYSLPNGNINGVPAKVPMLIPYSPIKIAMKADPLNNGYYTEFQITDTDGTRYVFGGRENPNSREFNYNGPNVQGGVPTGWYLSSITSADKTDKITLSYESKTYDESVFSESFRVTDGIRNQTAFNYRVEDPYWETLAMHVWDTPFEETSDYAVRPYGVPAVKSVQFTGGSLVFNYTTVPQSFNNSLLDEILINGTDTRKIKFTSILHPNEIDIYYLKNVSFCDNQNTTVEQYTFNYYEPLHGMISDPSWRSAKNSDWWGYYSRWNDHTFPQRTIDWDKPEYGHSYFGELNIGFPNVSRIPDTTLKVLGMLKSIRYPTGGETEFLYESNKYHVDYAPPNAPSHALVDGAG